MLKISINDYPAEANAPNKKYFMAASFDDGSRFANAASAYVGMLISSMLQRALQDLQNMPQAPFLQQTLG